MSLKQRLEYLARAVMCMRSETVGYAPHLGLFLRDLEDKIEIGKVQEKILNAIVSVRSTHEEAQQAVTNLNANLYDITQVGCRNEPFYELIFCFRSCTKILPSRSACGSVNWR